MDETEPGHVDPELTRKLAEQEMKRRMDPDYNLALSAKRKVAAEMERDAKTIKDQIEGKETEPSLEEVADRAATLASEGVNPEDAAAMAKGRKSVVIVKSDAKAEGEKKKTRYTVLDNGNIITDPDGEMTLSEALVASRNLKQSSGPAYYVHNPETGDFIEAKGPMIFHQPSPPQVLQVTPEGEVKEVKHGEPIVIVKQQPSAQQPSKSWIIKPGTGGQWEVEEYEPGKPIIISQPPASTPYSPTLPIQPTDSQGHPIGGAIPMPMPDFLQYSKTMQEMKHEEEKHSAVMEFIAETKKEIPRIIKALDRQGRKEGKAAPSEIEQAASEMDIRKCQSCGTVFATPKGITEVLCPNPQCPLNIKGEK